MSLLSESSYGGSPFSLDGSSTSWLFADWKRYEPSGLIGEGGMGRVYKVFDRRLCRPAALKLIREQSGQNGEDLIREARLQGQLSHPNVCRVYDAGFFKGHPYVSFQFVDGPTLAAAAPELTLVEKVTIMRSISEAVHSAHEEGLVHRDIKPTNILLERMDDRWQAFITDFGLARTLGDSISSTGRLAGTPQYIAPEQLMESGHSASPKADVYSLGATLYELIAGRPPFTGETTADLLLSVVREEPGPLHDFAPSISPDLETIVLKALEKDPERRYASAQAFADDLGRFLMGQAIQARPATRLDRLMRLISRHRFVSFLILVCVSLALTLLTHLVISERRSAMQERLGSEFSDELVYLRDLMRHSYTSPLHDTREERERVRARLATFVEHVQSGGEIAQGPGQYVIGKVLLDLRDYDAAARHLDLAWESRYARPEVAFARGYVNGALYQRELQKAERIPDPEERQKRKEELGKTYRQAAVDSLQQSRGVMSQSPALLEGLIAFYDGRYDESLERLRSVREEFPWQYEASLVQARIHAILGNEARDRGDHFNADEHYRESDAAWLAAIDIGRSDPLLHQGRCALWVEIARLQSWFDGDSRQALNESIAACDRALLADPTMAAALVSKSDALIQQGVEQRQNGAPPAEQFSRAADLAGKAVEIDPEDASARYYLSLARWWLAVEQFRNGEDPRPSLEVVIENLEQTVSIHPTYSFAYDGLGNAYLLRSDYEARQGGSSVIAYLEKAVENYQKATSLRPTFMSYNNLAFAFLHLARQSPDPEQSLDRAVANAARAVQMNSSLAFPHVTHATALSRLAESRMSKGADPRSVLQKAKASIDSAMRLDPEYWEIHLVAGLIHRATARWNQSQGIDPEPELDLYRNSILAAQELNPDDPMIASELLRFDDTESGSFLAALSDLTPGGAR
jgi:eukaryotic-like serine/threonine-protein kinase